MRLFHTSEMVVQPGSVGAGISESVVCGLDLLTDYSRNHGGSGR